MPDNITFNTIPVDLLTPGVYVEVDNSKAVRGLPGMDRRILVIGNKLPAGSAAAATVYPINAAAEAAGLFGRGSVLHEMLTALRAANKTTAVYAIGLTDDAGGTAATQTVTVTGPATAAGSIALYINGTRLNVGVASGDSVTQVATAITNAVTAFADGPVTAASAAGVVTLTARHKGAFTSDIDVRLNYAQGEVLPAGIGIAIAAGTAGAGNPDVASALAAITMDYYYTLVTPYNDATNVGKLETELVARWGGMDMRTGHLFGGYKGTYGNSTTFGNARNSPHSSFMPFKSAPNPTYVWGAVLAGVCEFNGAIDPARPLQSLQLPGLLAPALADRFTSTERNLLLKAGLATFTVDQGGNVFIERVVTTYKTNPQGITDPSYQDLETKWTVDFMRYAFRADIALTYPRHKLADDGTSFAPGQAIATPNMIRGTLMGTARKLEIAGMLEGFSQFKDELKVVRSISDRNRVNAILPADVVNQFRVFAGSVQFIL